MEADHESRWPDLPLDLLGLVLGRLPFLADRIRFGAVCRRLRSSIKLLPPYPQLPWIVLHDGTLFDLTNNVPVYQVRLPRDASCYSAGDNMLFLLHDDGRCSLMNALSGDTTHLLELAAVLRNNDVLEEHVRKVVMSKSLPDHGPIIIALLVGNMVILSSCRPAGETNSCLVAMIAAPIDDISFYQDMLYALSGHRLIFFELANGRFDKPTPPGDRPVYIAGNTVYIEGLHDEHNLMQQYLVESSGKLLVVMLGMQHMYSDDGEMLSEKYSEECICEVWESDMSERRWKKVEGGLGGRALAVSSPCSKSLLAAADSLHGAREDCIYFMYNRLTLRSGVYNMRTKTFAPLPQDLTPLLQELTPPVEIDYRRPLFTPKNKSVRFPAWFYPDNVTPTGGTYGKVRRGGGESQPVGAKPWRTCATFFPFHPMHFVYTANWIRKWSPVNFP